MKTKVSVLSDKIIHKHSLDLDCFEFTCVLIIFFTWINKYENKYKDRITIKANFNLEQFIFIHNENIYTLESGKSGNTKKV